MCIICAKPANVKFPSEETIKNMWDANSDGAGLIYVKDGKVRIEKGFMTYKSFTAKLDELRKTLDLVKTPVVMHFRITTHGGTCAANTHPFPVTDSIARLKQTNVTTTLGVAHNGIIPITPRKGISDTMEYIATQLSPLTRALPDWYHSTPALELVRNALHSKLAVLDSSGEIVTIGDFVEDNGVLYSNTSFRGWGKRWVNANCYSGFDFDGWDDYYPTTASRSGGKKSKSKKKSSGAKTDAKTYPITIKKAPLMWLVMADEGAYVSDPKTGHIIEGADFLLDADEHVYVYDPTFDAASRTKDYRAYTANGSCLRFNEELACGEYIITDNDQL